MRFLALPLAFSVAAVAFAGCNGVTDPSKNKVETFSGMVAVGGFGNVHQFTVDKTGEMSMRITSLSPTQAAVLGSVFGQPTSGGCGIISTNAFTGLNRDIFQQPIQKGTYCVYLYDSGNLTVAQSYSLDVSHP